LARPRDSFDYVVSTGVADMTWFVTQSYNYDTQARLLGDLLFADPIMCILANWHKKITATRYFIRHVVPKHESCTLKYRNIYMRGFVVLAELLRKRQDGYLNDAKSTWNARRALGLRGTSQGLVSPNLTVGNLLAGYVQPVNFSNEPVALTYHAIGGGNFGYHCSFDDIREIALMVQTKVSYQFQRNVGSLSRYGSHRLASMMVSDDEISYTLSNPFFQSYPFKRTLEVKGRVSIIIRRCPPDEGGFDISVEIKPFKVNYDRAIVSYEAQWKLQARGIIYHSLGTVFDTNVLIGGYNYAEQQAYRRPTVSGNFGGLMAAFDQNMAVYSPALFHTQGKALSDVMINFGQNFENLVQAPQFAELIESVFLNSPQLYKQIFASPGDGAHNALDRLTKLTKLLSGDTLAYNFAAVPTVKAVAKLFNTLKDFREGESSFVIEGSDLSSETESFVKAVMQGSQAYLGVDSSNVFRYKATFRTTVYTSLQASNASRAILMSNPLAAVGGFPTPSAIWESLAGSFVADWFLNIGPLIKDQQAYWSSPSVPLRIGHTVHLEFSYRDGRRFNNFWRSVESSLPIDPPHESWLPYVGLPVISIPYGILQVFRLKA